MYDASFFKKQFLLRDDITFLNFGSFGATPKPVFEASLRWQTELEREPVHFITEQLVPHLKAARESLAGFLHCDADDVVYVTNPSYAVNIIAKSFDLQEGDEVLATNLEYGACDRTWTYYCRQKGAVYVRQPIRFPIASKEDFIEQFTAGITAKTKLIFISHITSSTGLRLPVEEICAIARQRNIITFIDGAHGPAQVSVDLSAMDADIYTGACHKWMLSPKGASFLYVRRSLQDRFDPLVVSWGYDSAMPSHSRFLDYHQLQGTKDYSAFLSVPDAIRFMEQHDWPAVRVHCRTLVQDNAARFCSLLKTEPLAPVNDDFIAQLYSIRISVQEPEKLHRLLYERYNIQVPVMQHEDQCYMRYSIQAFNTQEDLDKLYIALQGIGL